MGRLGGDIYARTTSMIQVIKKVLSGSFLVQCMGVVIVPALVFAYSAEDVGYYGMFFSISAVLSVVLSLRMENLFFL